ncbi:MAG TPA: DUF3137 domain-containing protein [Acidimicrobiales bacterium]|nr:DUF3137 domain-containing protein [Acidimicrobiales bacterium]
MSQFGQVLHDNPLLRDFAIAAGIVVLLVLINIPLSIRRRVKRHEARKEHERISALPGGADPIPGLDALARSRGWEGPTTQTRFDNEVTRYAHEMLRNLWGYPRGAEEGETTAPIAPDNIYTNLFHGQVDGKDLTIGNTRLNVAPFHLPGLHAEPLASVCVLRLSMTMPPLFINLHHRRPYSGLFLKKVDFESEEFNRTFVVEASDPKYATDVITPQVMEVVLTREDWTFAFLMDHLVCLSASGLHTADDYAQRADTVARIASLIPGFVADDDAIKLPTLPDGTVLRPEMTEDEQQKAMAAFMAMAPDEREKWMVQMQTTGLESIGKMFGKHFDPAMIEAAVQKQTEQRRKEHPELFEGPPPGAPGAPPS